MPPSCRQPMNVDVLRWPCGALAIRRSPRGALPYSRTMLVFTEVSSRKNSLPAFRLGEAGQGSACVAGGMPAEGASPSSPPAPPRRPDGPARPHAESFFMRQPELGERAVHQPVAGRDAMHRAEPATQLGQGGVRARRHLGPDRIVKPEQLWRHVATLRACRCLATVPPPAERLRNVGHADTQSFGDLADSVPGIAQRKHPLTEILGIRPTTPPLHPNPPAKTNRRASNPTSTPIASSFSILVSLRTL